jgi:hypothetical protein
LGDQVAGIVDQEARAHRGLAVLGLQQRAHLQQQRPRAFVDALAGAGDRSGVRAPAALAALSGRPATHAAADAGQPAAAGRQRMRRCAVAAAQQTAQQASIRFRIGAL